MRAGGCAVQQTLTAEAAAAVRNAVALARRRGHAQATPLHVAATLLASDSGLLRRACLQSHGATAQYPLQCRALELCFNVALNRLPAAAAVPHGQPSLSNALIAALKRAQAHQRRGCIEQQAAQPLLAVKVEMEQLVVSILDDPSVSRVMREAGFFSTRVKTNVVESSSNSAAVPPPWRSPPDLRPLPPPPPAARDVDALVEALVARKRKNTVIIGEDMAYTDYVVRHLMTRIHSGDVPEPLKSLQFIRPHLFLSLPLYSRDETEQKVAELHRIVQNCCCYHRGAVLYVGDLRWTLTNYLAAYPSSYGYSGVEDVVVEVGRMLACYGEKIRLVGTATYETYMRCNMRQPSLESHWELQPFTVPAGGLSLSLISSEPAQDAGKEGGHVLSAWKNTPLNNPFTSLHHELEKLNCCRECSANYDVEARLICDHNSLATTPSQQSQAASNSLPSWLRPYLQDQPKELPRLNEMVGDLRKKWNHKCAQIHQEKNQATMQQKEIQLSCRWNMDGDTMFRDSQSQQQSPSGSSIAPNFSWASKSPLDTQCSNWSVIECSSSENNNLNKTRKFLMGDDTSASRMEVETTLALGMSSPSDSKKSRPNQGKPWWHTAPSSPVSVGNGRSGRNEDKCHGRLRKFEVESLRMFCKTLEEKVTWQGKVAQPIATAVLRCRSGIDKRPGDDGLKGDVWLLFLGSDRVGKRNMAKALAEIVYGSNENFISIEKLKDLALLEMFADILRQNPHSVIFLEDIEETDIGVRKALSSAMETGKLLDLDLSLSDVIIVMSSSLGTKDLAEEDKSNGSMNKKTRMRLAVVSEDDKLCSRKFSGCRSRVRVLNSERLDDPTKLAVTCPFKRKADWAVEERSTAPMNGNTSDKRIGVALDLNYTSKEREAYGASCNYAEELGVLSSAQEYLSRSFMRFIDKTVVFGEFDLVEASEDLLDEINAVFLRNTGGKGWLELDKNVMDKFSAVACYYSPSPTDKVFSKWLNDVFMGGLVKLFSHHELAEETVVRLVAEESLESGTYYQNSSLPTKIVVSSP